MRHYIENHQFYYVNTDIDEVKLDDGNLTGLDFGYVADKILSMEDNVRDSSDFLAESFKRIEDGIISWHASYMTKVQNLKNTNSLIMMGNITSDDDGFYALMEIDYGLSANIGYSNADDGIVLSSLSETYSSGR